MGLFDKLKNNKKNSLADPSTKSFRDYPFCESSFRQRVEICWNEFVKEEATVVADNYDDFLRRIMSGEIVL